MSMNMNSNFLSSFAIARVFKDNESVINSMDFSKCGEYLITGSDDESMILYNINEGKLSKKLLSKKYGVDLVRFTHHPNAIISASKNDWDHTLRYLSLHDNRYLRYFRGHRDRIISLEMSPLNDTFISGSLDGTVRLWDLQTNLCQGILKLNPDNSSSVGDPVACAFDPEGLIIAVGIGKNQIKLFDLRNLNQGPFLTFVAGYEKQLDWTGIKFSNDGKMILLSSPQALLTIDAFEGQLIRKYEGHDNSSGYPLEACFSPDGQQVFCGSEDGSIWVWNSASGAVESTWRGHAGPVGLVLFNPKYTTVASSCTNLALWLPRDDLIY